MGSSGICFQLERFSGKTSDGRLRSVVLNTLVQVWAGRRHALLPYEWKRFACDWICLGEDSLLTIEVYDGQITFWFYETVGWSEGLADHWLKLALAVRRGDFEAAFARIGYRINPKNWPDLENIDTESRYRFFHGDGGIGSLSNDEIYWQVKNGHYDLPTTPISELSPEARAEMEQIVATNRCRCCVCKSLWKVKPQPAEIPGFSATPEAIFATQNVKVFDVRPEGTIVSTGGTYELNWTGRKDAPGERWAGIVELSEPKRHTDAIFPAKDALVAHAVTNSGLRYVSTSTDGGRTWSEQSLLSGLGKAKKARLFHDAGTNDVYAAAQPAKVLFRSSDGGRFFDVLANDLQVDGKPIAYVDSLVIHENRIFAAFRTKKNERLFVVSEDNGASFKTIALPKFAQPLHVISKDSALFCFIQSGSFVACMRSVDGGTSFTERTIGTGNFASAAIGPQGIIVGLTESRNGGDGGVFYSQDGTSFVLASKHPAPNVFADLSGQKIGFFFSSPTLYSLQRQL